MAYEKQTWVTGEVITKEKLNHMEDGIANGGGVIAINIDEDNKLDKTWNEVDTALRNGQFVIVYGTDNHTAFCCPVVETVVEEGPVYGVAMLNTSARTVIAVLLVTNDPDGYPTVSQG